LNIKNLYQPIIFLVAAGILMMLDFLLPANSYIITLFSFMIWFAVLSVSWSIFSGSTGYISLAAAAFYGVGIYAAAIIGTKMPLIGIIIIGGLLSAALAAVVGAITLRLRGVYFTIFTFGLVALMQQFILYIEINFNHTRGRTLLYTGDVNSTVYLYLVGLFLVLMLVAYFLRRSRYGLALRAIGQNEEAAEHMGVNTTLYKILAFALSSFFMGAVGTIMAIRSTYIDPYIAFNFNYSFFPVLMSIFGGPAYLYGPVIGAILFDYLNETFRTRYPAYFLLSFGIIMVLAVTFLPNGILGFIETLIRRKWSNNGGKAKADALTGR
jgi:branched-chain amino acid transport system permease protein